MEPEALRALIAANIQELASARGLTIAALADFAGISRSHLDYVLNEEKAPTSDVLAKIAAALDVEPWELLRSG